MHWNLKLDSESIRKAGKLKILECIPVIVLGNAIAAAENDRVRGSGSEDVMQRESFRKGIEDTHGALPC